MIGVSVGNHVAMTIELPVELTNLNLSQFYHRNRKLMIFIIIRFMVVLIRKLGAITHTK